MAMEDRERQLGTNDMGLLLFIAVAVWVIVAYSGWF